MAGMLYTIQNSYGEVYGKFPLPEHAELSAEEWADKLRGKLGDILGINGVEAAPLLLNSQTGETVDRVVVDIQFDPNHASDYVQHVHETVDGIALGAED